MGLSSELLVVPEAEKWRQGSLFVQPHGVSNEDNDQVVYSGGVRVLSTESEERANVTSVPEAEATSDADVSESAHLGREADASESTHPASDADVNESAHSGRELDASESAHSGRESETSDYAHLEREGDEVESAGSVEVTVLVFRMDGSSGR
ncbi:hypothetical protein V6N11_031715 [Hibiscus sabdariffa]|uniref:Uncharacterized protein n=1 Tax=Hibiscus sabdariffa TaxID=183260 RepID=A0ABR2SYS2_9ROSI